MDLHACFHTDDKKYAMQTISGNTFSNQLISEKTKPNTNALGGRIWDEETLYWKCDTHYQWLTDSQIEGIVKDALLESSLQTPLKIQKKNRKMSDAQLVLSWLPKKDDRYLTSNSILAYCWGPGSGLGGNCIMNADVLWLLREGKLYADEAKRLGYIDNFVDPKNTIKYFDPVHTIKHELAGHGLGMNHITDIRQEKTAIMYPFYNGLRKFGDADIKYLQSLYGSAKVNKSILDVIREKIQNFAR